MKNAEGVSRSMNLFRVQASPNHPAVWLNYGDGLNYTKLIVEIFKSCLRINRYESIAY